MNAKNRFILNRLIASEFLLLNVVLLLYIFFSQDLEWLRSPSSILIILLLIFNYNLTWLFIILFIRENSFYFNKNYSYFKSLLISLFFFIGLDLFQSWLFNLESINPSSYLYPILIFIFLNYITHKYILRHLKDKQSLFSSDVLLISNGYNRGKLEDFSALMSQYRHNLVGYLDGQNNVSEGPAELEIFDTINNIEEVLTNKKIDEIFIDMAVLKGKTIKKVVEIADSFGIRVRLIPKKPIQIANNYETDAMGNLTIFKLRQSPLDKFSNALLKKLFDFCFAFTVIVVLAPLYIIIAFLIVIDSRGPIFYKPHRKGEAGNTFKCFKFRSMSTNDDPIHGTKSTAVNDKRITRVGKFLRKYDLDELPQFFNVLKGDMSVVGPRPHRAYLQDNFRKSVSDYMVRSYIKPGITGWAQVNGWRGLTDTEEQKLNRVKFDIWYIQNWSFWLDIKIIFYTLFGKKRSQRIYTKLIRTFF